MNKVEVTQQCSQCGSVYNLFACNKGVARDATDKEDKIYYELQCPRCGNYDFADVELVTGSLKKARPDIPDVILDGMVQESKDYWRKRQTEAPEEASVHHKENYEDLTAKIFELSEGRGGRRRR
jgi:hypothetical protein